MPVAAIEALILLLTHSPPSTISETLSLLATHTAHLKRSVRNPIPLSAGTDLFQRYLISSLQSPSSVASQRSGKHGRSGAGTGAGKDDFRAIRAHLMTNGRLFVKRAKEARGKIAAVARRFVRDGTTVLTSGGSRVVSAVLTAAAEEAVRFCVVYVRSSSPAAAAAITPPLVSTLRSLGVPVAIIPEGAVAYSMSQISTVMVGAEGVVENGGIISRMGTYQLGLLARSGGKPFYVVVESHKFVRLYPIGQGDLGFGSGGSDKGAGPGGTLDFRTDAGGPEAGGRDGSSSADEEEAVDFTPPELITALITESGVHTPSAVSEELIKIWY
ncbi:translation initiation factor eIF-2B subunit alpha [Pseudocyphellaria aurata]|nr:translation initiation factor eIF-2B subunit alpha [Pseudocyphellaria aurata]